MFDPDTAHSDETSGRASDGGGFYAVSENKVGAVTLQLAFEPPAGAGDGFFAGACRPQNNGDSTGGEFLMQWSVGEQNDPNIQPIFAGVEHGQ